MHDGVLTGLSVTHLRPLILGDGSHSGCTHQECDDGALPPCTSSQLVMAAGAPRSAGSYARGRLSAVSVDRVLKQFDSRRQGRRESVNLCRAGAGRLERSTYLRVGELRREGR